MHACIVEAHESTRKRLEGIPPKDHEDHIAGKGFNSLSHCNLVHKLVLMPQAMNVPDATAAVDKVCENLEWLPAWQLTKKKTKSSVSSVGSWTRSFSAMRRWFALQTEDERRFFDDQSIEHNDEVSRNWNSEVRSRCNQTDGCVFQRCVNVVARSLVFGVQGHNPRCGDEIYAASQSLERVGTVQNTTPEALHK